MEQADENFGLNKENIGQFLRRVVDDWRLEQRKSVRHRVVEFEDRLDKTEGQELPDADELRAGVVEARDRYMSKLDDRYAMIEEAHRQMVEHLDRCNGAAR